MALMAKNVEPKQVQKTVKTDTQLSDNNTVIIEDVHGRLDEFDFRTIQKMIDIYDHTFPYPHMASIDKLAGDMRKKRRDFQVGFNKFNELDKGSGLRHTMCIPEGLLAVIKTGYPNIIKDPIQYRQFLNRFKRFNVAEKY